jgi:lysyl-tRNA synthetase class 2
MATIKDFRDERVRKLGEIRAAGIEPYPAHSERNVKIGEILGSFGEKEARGSEGKTGNESVRDGENKGYEGKEVVVAGRVVSIRSFGKLAFVGIEDESGRIQVFLRDEGGENEDSGVLGTRRVKLLDTGDFVEVRGKVGRSQTGEISVFAEGVRLLTKSLRPMPGRDGFTNKEERLRRRYVDMAVNPEVRERFVRRSKFWTATREFLNKHGFIEVNIPVLEHTTGGADANPFVTHMDALDQDFYLRISHELPLKRLLGGGFERVYDIGARFRNEGMTEEHLPEHVAMEWYAAYEDAEWGRKFMEEMYKYVCRETWGSLKFKVKGFEVDMEGRWEIWDYATVIRERYGIDVYESSLEEVKRALRDNGLEVEKTENRSRGVDKLWKNIRKGVAGPVWLVNTPKFISPLAKSNADGVSVQRFQPVIAGSELGNGFSELNDPIDQLARFTEQQEMRDAGDAEAMMLDMDFVEMLEYGMPPACGWGYSERVFWTFEGVSAREGVPFPPMRRGEE